MISDKNYYCNTIVLVSGLGEVSQNLDGERKVGVSVVIMVLIMRASIVIAL